jgi:DNA/RNA-binding domain of Phe-tRNA-synthetase-like protein
MDSLRGRFHLGGKPLMADSDGPFGTPITDSERIRVTAGTRRAWLVAYLPDDAVAAEEAGEELARLLGQAPVATLDLVGTAP